MEVNETSAIGLLSTGMARIKSSESGTATTSTIGASGANNATECSVRDGWFFWRKVKILVEHARFNVKKCELQYCTPSLEIETFT